jgi:hypothetical protein
MTTTLNTSCSENTMVLSARRGVSACMYFLVQPARRRLAKHVLTKGQQVSGVTSYWVFIIQSRDKNMHFSPNIPSFSLYI